MKRSAKFFIPVLLILLLVISLAAVKLVADIGNYGRLINYVGIVRGASQRVIKLETNMMPSNDLIDYVDGILEELETGKGEYGLVIPQDIAYRNDLSMLSKQWNIVKEGIQQVRNGADPTQLLLESEELFDIANNTVFAIEDYSSRQTADLSRLIFIMTVACIVACIIVVTFYIKRMVELRHKNETLEDIAFRDEVTGAYTLEKFKAEAEAILEQNPSEKFAVVYMDFENFKYINDVFGYDCGDGVLKTYAELMMEDMGEYEVFGHNTADQFVALCRYTDKNDLIDRHRRIDRELVERIEALKNKYMITLVYGICCVEDAGRTCEMATLLNYANFAQKTVKNHAGKHHYAFYNESIRKKMIEEVTIMSRMHEALRQNEFIVYLQPKVSLKSRRVECAEALVRWNMPGKGIVSPDHFIPIFERCRFISALDQYVFEKICVWLCSRLDQKLEVLPVSVNVSRIQFYDPDFVSVYTEMKERYRIPNQLIEIEFTETVAFENQQYMIQTVKDLRAKGFRCSLDDFGKGYSSLGVLKDMPIDVLKLDAAFFTENMDAEKDYTVLKGIISIARNLHIQTVAEGVEWEKQVEFLRAEGCDFVQGYYYYKPMPIADFETLIKTQKE